mgnify:CR=1 FL=1
MVGYHPRKCYQMVVFSGVILLVFHRIRDLREDNDKTQRQIADYLVMNLDVYRRYENGQREIPVWAVIRLADYYHTSTDYILGRTDRREPV